MLYAIRIELWFRRIWVPRMWELGPSAIEVVLQILDWVNEWGTKESGLRICEILDGHGNFVNVIPDIQSNRTEQVVKAQIRQYPHLGRPASTRDLK